jgi:hypothetical protein
VKIVLLSTGRGLRPEFIEELSGKLGLHDSDVVCLVSWHPARAPMPVNHHLVLGPHLRVAGALATVQKVQKVQKVQRLPEPAVGNGQELSAGAASPTGTDSPAGAVTPTGTDSPAGDADTGGQGAPGPLPMLHPRRLRKAVAWRARRLRKAVGTRTSTGLSGVRTHPQFRRVRNRLTPGVSLSFAASCLRAGKVHDMIRDADLVVALDASSHRGAWALAQKVAGPDVVIGVPAAKRLIEEGRAQRQAEASKASRAASAS